VFGQFYTPVVGGSIPSAPTKIWPGQRHNSIQSGLTDEPPAVPTVLSGRLDQSSRLARDRPSSASMPGPLGRRRVVPPSGSIVAAVCRSEHQIAAQTYVDHLT
jgi:hypothetical protein